MAKLSIIIPTFNSAGTIQACLESIASQTFRDFEVIVQDGGSTDGTVEKVWNFRTDDPEIDVKLVVERDKGPYDAMNRGVRRACGEWLYFLGSDDELHDASVLSAIFGRLDLADWDVLYGDVRVFGNSDWAKSNPVYGGVFDLEKLLHQNICHQAIFYRATFFRGVGEYNIRYVIYADWDFNMRCWSRTCFKHVDVTVANYYAGGLSSSGRDECFKVDVASNVLRYFNLSAHDRLVNRPAFVGFSDIMEIKESKGLMPAPVACPCPTVSVVIPNYNHARFLRRRIESVLRQTYQDFELILLDDCSTDESREILSRYAGDARVRIEFNEANSGSTFRQWNKGVRIARGEYVWIAESDDYADERLLERLVGVLEADESAAFAYCRSWCVDDDGRVGEFVDRHLEFLQSDRWDRDFLVDGREECAKYFAVINTVANASAVVFRRETYGRVGGADETFRMCGDWKLWAAMALTGKIAYVSEALNYYRFHDASVRSKSIREARNICEGLRVINWVTTQVPEGRPALKKIDRWLADNWVPALLSMHVPRDVKRMIWREMLKIDPHAWRKVGVPILTTLGLKVRRHWRDAAAFLNSRMRAGA